MYRIFNCAIAEKSDVSFYRISKMAAIKTEAAIGTTFEQLEITTQFQLLLSPHFRTGLTWIWHCRHCPTLPEVGWLPEFRMAATKPAVNIFFSTVRGGATISTSISAFSAMPGFDLTHSCRLCQTSADIRNSRWWPSKPKVVTVIFNSGTLAINVGKCQQCRRRLDESSRVANVA